MQKKKQQKMMTFRRYSDVEPVDGVIELKHTVEVDMNGNISYDVNQVATKSKQQWYEELLNLEAFCYIKPTRYKHSSGFRCFEVGYLTVTDRSKVKDKLILSIGSDHIQLYEYFNNKIQPNLDLLLDGYIRIYPIGTHQNYWWGSMDFALSSAQLTPLVDELGISKFNKKKQ